jgi:hypothetical protein
VSSQEVVHHASARELIGAVLAPVACIYDEEDRLDDYLDQLRRSLEQELGLPSMDTTKDGPAAQDGVSLIITREQRGKLRERGFTDKEIRDMTPAQAHQHLGLSSFC